MRSHNSLEEIAELYGLLENIKKEYEYGIRSALRKSNPELFSNPHTIPKLKKISINRGLGLAAQNTNILKKSVNEFTKITGQKPLITKAKKAVAGFKIRDKMPVGVSVTLRGDRMYGFLDRLIHLALPRVRDFQGINPKSFDKHGNFSLGLEEQLMFPEIEYDKIDQIRGMDICIVTTAKNQEEGFSLLKEFGFPFKS